MPPALATSTSAGWAILALLWNVGLAGAACDCESAPANFTGVVIVDGVQYDYGSGYGFGACAAWDAGLPPRCGCGVDPPAWCTAQWCYVNSRNCSVASAPSALFSELAYSYPACNSSATADLYNNDRASQAGLIRLCSVFSATDPSLVEVDTGGGLLSESTPCGNSATHLQVIAMVTAINSLNDGLGFPVEVGYPLAPRHLRLAYAYQVYPFGAWEGVGLNLSRRAFSGPSCDVVVGMAQGCPDDEIAKQGLVANETRRIFITGRGPRGVRTLYGLDQPYFFSTHLNSDTYAHPALAQMRLLGARSVHVIYEDYGNYFYTDLGREALRGAREMGYSATSSVLTRRGSEAYDGALLNASLDAALAARADVLVAVMRQPEWFQANVRLSLARPGTSSAAKGGHAFQAVRSM